MIGRLEVDEGFGETGLLEVMAELGVDLFLVFRVPSTDGLRHLPQGIEMGRWVAIAPRVIRDHVLAPFEQIHELLMHVGSIKHGSCSEPISLLANPRLPQEADLIGKLRGPVE